MLIDILSASGICRVWPPAPPRQPLYISGSEEAPQARATTLVGFRDSFFARCSRFMVNASPDSSQPHRKQQAERRLRRKTHPD